MAWNGHGMNEHFVPNMTGKPVSFDVQPYSHGKGVIEKITPRVIEVSDFDRNRGRTRVTHEVFDLEIRVESGRSIGALAAGVPVPGTIHDTAGKVANIIGVTFGQIYEAVENGKPIVIARCG